MRNGIDGDTHAEPPPLSRSHGHEPHRRTTRYARCLAAGHGIQLVGVARGPFARFRPLPSVSPASSFRAVRPRD